MTDNITLRRAAEQARSAIRGFYNKYSDEAVHEDAGRAIAALDTALAEPEQPQKARPDFLAGYDAGLADGRRCAERDAQDARDAAIVAAALAEPRPAPSLEFFDGFRDGFRAAERHHGIAKEDK